MKKYSTADLKIVLAYFCLAIEAMIVAFLVGSNIRRWVESMGCFWIVDTPYFDFIAFVGKNFYWTGLFILACLDLRRRNFVRVISYTAGIAFCNLTLHLFLCYGPSLIEVTQRTKFDSNVWKQKEAKNSWGYYKRMSMVHDLRNTHRLVGMSRTQLLELLGPPSEEWPNGEYLYWLGPQRKLGGVDDDWLVIKFAQDIIIEVAEQTH